MGRGLGAEKQPYNDAFGKSNVWKMRFGKGNWFGLAPLYIIYNTYFGLRRLVSRYFVTPSFRRYCVAPQKKIFIYGIGCWD